MQKLRTKAKFWLFIIGVIFSLSAPLSVKSFKVDTFSKRSLHNLRYVHISEIFERTDDDNTSLITYQSIDQASDETPDKETENQNAFRLFEVTISGFDDASDTTLISTLSDVSCEESWLSKLPAWKINKTVGETFRLRVNHAEQLDEKTLFLCLFDNQSRTFKHLGNDSRLQIDG